MSETSPQSAGLPRAMFIAASVLALASGWAIATVGPLGGETPAPTAKHLVVIVMDSVRADHVGPSDERPVSSTPTLDIFAEGAWVFDHATTPVVARDAADAALLSSAWPAHLGFDNLPATSGFCDRQDLTTLAEHLNALGFHTEAVVQASHVRPVLGAGRGFDVWNGVPADTLEEASAQGQATGSRRTLQSIRDAVERANTEQTRQFIYVHLTGADMPLRPSWEARRRADGKGLASDTIGGKEMDEMTEALAAVPAAEADAARAAIRQSEVFVRLDALYRAAVYDADAELRRLLEELNTPERRADTVVAVVSNRGFAMFEDGHWGPGAGPTQANIAVPWLVRGPGLTPGHDPRPVSTVDLAPTLTARLGLPPHPAWSGNDVTTQPRTWAHAVSEGTTSIAYRTEEGLSTAYATWTSETGPPSTPEALAQAVASLAAQQTADRAKAPLSPIDTCGAKREAPARAKRRDR